MTCGGGVSAAAAFAWRQRSRGSGVCLAAAFALRRHSLGGGILAAAAFAQRRHLRGGRSRGGGVIAVLALARRRRALSPLINLETQHGGKECLDLDEKSLLLLCRCGRAKGIC
jgi:hypothetical protein